jgi:hypothetical protein
MKSRTPDEIFVWGAVYVKASPESYVQFASDFDRLGKLPEFLAIRKFSNPPRWPISRALRSMVTTSKP